MIDSLKSTFKISAENATAFMYISVEIVRLENGVYLCQDHYASDSRKVDWESLLNEEERCSLRSLIGQLNWLSTQSRPDIAYDVSKL